MTQTVELPLWFFVLIVLFAAVTFASHFLFPSVRWFFRRRLERAVARLNQRLERPIQPFKLARRHDMIQRLIYDPDVSVAIQAHARETGVPEAVAFEQARRYAREIVPSFSAFAYFSFAIRAARYLSNAFYDVKVNQGHPKVLQSVSKDATVVFVMNHRSNMDYVLVTYLAAQQSALSYAVGEWARVWPLSRLIRAMGAYFIRRKSRSDLYRQVLATYVSHATEAGVTQAIFPEGGLSLTGALGKPKLGLLKYMVDDAAQYERDLVFVPVALNYDRVLEDTILTAAASRSEKRFRARIGVVFRWLAKQLWLRLTGRGQKFGYAAVKYGEPLSLRAFREGREKDVTVPLARELLHRIEASISVLPVPLAAFLMRQNTQMSQSEMRKAFAKVEDSLGSGLLSVQAMDAALEALVSRRMLNKTGETYALSSERQDVLAYYAASVAHSEAVHSAAAKGNSATAGL